MVGDAKTRRPGVWSPPARVPWVGVFTDPAFLLMAFLYIGGVMTCVAAAGAPFAYPLDDTYIHLALARTLATTGVWGVQPQDAAAASSSPMWTLLLASVYRLWPARYYGMLLALPLALNLLFGVLSLAIWTLILKRGAPAYGAIWRAAALAVITFITALVPISCIGMEHTAQIFICVSLAWCAARALAGEDHATGAIRIALLSALAVGVRYESLFLVAPLGAIALLRRRLDLAAALGVGAVAPVVGFGVYWMARGGWPLPNSLLLKAVEPLQAAGALGAFKGVIRNLWEGKISSLALAVVLALMAALVARTLARRERIITTPVLMAAVTLAATGLQYALGSLGWLYRYEAWLLALGAVSALLLVAASWPPQAWRAPRRAVALTLCGVVCLVATGVRSVDATRMVIGAPDDRRQEHLAVARFLAANYQGQPVIVNDVGFAAYYGRSRLLDLFGLAANAPVRFRREPGGFGAARLDAWAHEQHAGLAVVQICWSEVKTRIPPSWRLVEVWRFPRNVVFADHYVGFFDIDGAHGAQIAADLGAFQRPATVRALHPSTEEWNAFREAAAAHRPPPPPLTECPAPYAI